MRYLPPVLSAGLLLLSAMACAPAHDFEAELTPGAGPYEARGELVFAAHSRFTLEMVDACVAGIAKFLPSPCQTDALVEVLNVELDDESIVRFAEVHTDNTSPSGRTLPPTLGFEAVAEGQTELTVLGLFDDGTEREATEVITVRAGEVFIDTHGRCGWTEEEPALLHSGELHAVKVHAVDAAGERLNGDLGFPYETAQPNAVTASADEENANRFILHPHVQGVVELTPAAPLQGPSMFARFYGPGEADDLFFSMAFPGARSPTWSEIEVNSGRVFQSTPVFDDRQACFGSAWVNIDVDTPEICEVSSWARSKDGRRVRGLAPGDCVLQVNQAGLTRELIIPIVEDAGGGRFANDEAGDDGSTGVGGEGDAQGEGEGEGEGEGDEEADD